jgi:pentose-5-phosphate-3-epimerase
VRTTPISTSRQGLLDHIAGSIPLIAPSMLKCDFGNLHREVELLEAGGAKILHMDVMDGHFVPNLSYGAMVIERIRELTELPFEAHLMISEPARYLDDFLKAGCFGGQKFIPSALGKLAWLRSKRKPGTFASVDGGIDLETIADVAGAGANMFVAGSAIFEAGDYGGAIAELARRAHVPVVPR